MANWIQRFINAIATHKADANAHHTPYTDAEAKAAAVQAGAITNGVTKAPTHDAVYDVKTTADTATTPAEVDGKITTHKADASAHHTKFTTTEHTAIGDGAPHHTKYTNANAVSAMGAKADANPLNHDKTWIARGSYTGNDDDNRQIATGFICSLVIVIRAAANYERSICFSNDATIRDDDGADNALTTDLQLHATNGFVVDRVEMNKAGTPYRYWAISA